MLIKNFKKIDSKWIQDKKKINNKKNKNQI
jgi:hypothetical protein